MLVGPDEVSPGGGEESEQQREVPDGERQKEAVSEQSQSSAIRNEVESTDDRPKTSVIHKEKTEEKPEGSKENTTGSEHEETSAVEKPPAPEPRQKDPAPKATDSEMRDKSSTSTKSGRQSLKSRVKKVMWLGRMHGSGRSSSRREDVEDAVISQIANPPSNTNVVNNTVEQPAVEKEISKSVEEPAVEKEISKPSENEMSNDKNMSETSIKSNDERISSEDDRSVSISKAVEPNQAMTPEDSDQKQSQVSQDNNEITEVKGTVDKEDSPLNENKAEEETNPENNSNKDVRETGFEVDSLNTAEDESEKNTEEHFKQEEIEDGNNNESSEETLKSGISGARRAEAERLVATGDMEAMAEMVLAGEGDALLDLTSDNPDVQLFINNVPQYMAKIEKVHKCSREGDLRGVRTSLDRRKYAVARDNSTSLKPTPLHVAVLFGRTSVLRYLAGRFPETMHAQDSGGRTPLHYAATLPDNGHFYSLLITLGADKAIVDNAGKTAEEYLKDKEGLSREMLLAEYQDRPVPIDTSGLNFNRYSDKGAELLREGYPIFRSEESQYLASSLGEPLIKGLTEVAQLRPTNPILHLANFLLAYNKPEDPTVVIEKGIRSIEGTPSSRGRKEDENGNQMEEDENENENEEPKDNEEMNDNEETNDNDEDREDNKKIKDDDDEEAIEDEDDDISSSPEQDEDSSFKQINRDEHGQSMLHFAAARSHGRNAMFQLLQEIDCNPGFRDSLYRTARDIAEESDIPDNIRGIDKYVVSLAARGEENKLKELLLEGYDHIVDAEDDRNISDVAESRGQTSVVKFLKGIPAFEENREKLHRAIRFGSLAQVQEIFRKCGSRNRLAISKNNLGRCSLHVAVLAQHESTVEHIASKYPATLQIGDNLMRTPLHYAMALEKVESLSRILISAGAQRVLKDLKGRQASYYFMNKTDIRKLQDEEEALRV